MYITSTHQAYGRVNSQNKRLFHTDGGGELWPMFNQSIDIHFMIQGLHCSPFGAKWRNEEENLSE